MAITMKDVAKKCGVSTMTVSLAMSGSIRIPEKTRKKILKAVEELQYHRNVIASNLAKNAAMNLAAVVPQLNHIFTDPFFGEAISGIYDAAQLDGYDVLLKVASPQFISQKIYLRLFQEKKIDGMLYIAGRSRDTYLRDFLKFKFPLIQVGTYLPGIPLPYIVGDNLMGGYLAAKHLIGLGHKKIAMITGNFGILSARDRHEGYKNALQEAGIPYDRNLAASANFDEQTAYVAMQGLLKEGVTAVFCGNDLMAIGAIKAIKKSGLQVPQDIAIVGMDNIRLGEMITPSLTTVQYNVYSFAGKAVRNLVEIIQSYKQNKKVNVKEVSETVPVELVIRDSCGYKSLQSELASI